MSDFEKKEKLRWYERNEERIKITRKQIYEFYKNNLDIIKFLEFNIENEVNKYELFDLYSELGDYYSELEHMYNFLCECQLLQEYIFIKKDFEIKNINWLYQHNVDLLLEECINKCKLINTINEEKEELDKHIGKPKLRSSGKGKNRI